MGQLLLQLGQFGAVGLVAAFLLYMNMKHQKQMGERLMRLENNLMDIVKNNTAAMNRISNVIGSLKCVEQNPVAAEQVRNAAQLDSARLESADA